MKQYQKPRTKRIWHKLGYILFSYPTDTWEFGNSIVAVGVGAWLFLPYILTFTTGQHFPTAFDMYPEIYGNFNHVMSAWGWGFVASLAGFYGLCALFVKRWSAVRISASGALLALWLTIGWGIGKQAFFTFGTPVFSLMSLVTGLAFLRLLMLRYGFYAPEYEAGPEPTPPRRVFKTPARVK